MADAQTEINSSYPLNTYRYKVKVGDDEISCSEISGLTIEYESFDHKEATKDGIKTYRMLGQQKPGAISLKGGLFLTRSKLLEWLEKIHTNEFTKKDISVSLLDNSQNAIMTWNILNAFPTKFEGPSLNASENAVAFQSLEFNADEIKVAK